MCKPTPPCSFGGCTNDNHSRRAPPCVVSGLLPTAGSPSRSSVRKVRLPCRPHFRDPTAPRRTGPPELAVLLHRTHRRRLVRTPPPPPPQGPSSPRVCPGPPPSLESPHVPSPPLGTPGPVSNSDIVCVPSSVTFPEVSKGAHSYPVVWTLAYKLCFNTVLPQGRDTSQKPRPRVLGGLVNRGTKSLSGVNGYSFGSEVFHYRVRIQVLRTLKGVLKP